MFNPDIRDIKAIHIIAGSAAGGIFLIVVLLILVICTIVLRKKNKRLKKDIPPEVLNLKKFQTEQIQKVADQLINKGKNPKGVIEAVGKMTVKINESRVRTDEAGEEDELQDEQDKMQKILSDYVDYMKKQLTEELTKEHKKLNEKFH